MKQKKRKQRKISWGLGIIISDSNGSKLGRIVKIPNRILKQAKPIKNSLFLNPEFEEIMKQSKK